MNRPAALPAANAAAPLAPPTPRPAAEPSLRSRIAAPANNAELLTKVLSLMLILVTVWVLNVAQEVFVPLALALLFSFLLAPVVTRLERWRFPRVLAVLSAVGLALAIVAAVGYLVVGQLFDLAGKLPDYKDNIKARIVALKSGASKENPLTKATQTIEDLGKEISGTTPTPNATRPNGPTSANKEKVVPVEVVEPATNLPTVLRSVFGPILGPAGTAAIVVVFVLFMLIKREDLRDRIIHLIGRGRLIVTTQALDEAAQKVQGYLFMQLIVNVSFGIPVGLGLYFIGIPNAFLWGMLAILLRFVPYVGAWIALGFPLILSLATNTTWSKPAEVLALFATIELLTSNVLEPWLYGAHTGLSPVAIMVATIFWTWLWGGVGLLLATPLTVCVAVLGKYIPSLSFLDALLGDEPTLSPQDRFYQRLLALDRHEAEVVSTEYLKEHTLEELYSDVFVPALAQAEREEQSGLLDARHQRFIFETSRELIEEHGVTAQLALTGGTHGTHGADKKDKAAANGHKAEKDDGKEKDPQIALTQAIEGTESKIPKKGLPADKPNPDADGASGAKPTHKLHSNKIVYCLPAADEADEIVALMVAQLLEQDGYRAETVSYKTLANEMVSLVGAAASRVVCISATPPHNTLHTRYLCKKLRDQFPNLHIVVGLWDAEIDEAQNKLRRERLAADKVVTLLGAALEDIKPFAVLDAVVDEEAGEAKALPAAALS